MRGLKQSLILITLFLSVVSCANAQWVQQNNPSNDYLFDIFFLNNNTGWASGMGVLKTTNGGTNWVNLGTPYEGSSLTDIWFLDANTGFLSAYGFYKTTNGGANWTNTGLPIGLYSKIFFINSTTGWLVKASRNIYKTTDAGSNWTVVFTGSSLLESVNFINANTGWICGENGFISKTTDGGSNWITQTSGTANTLKDIVFSDANTGRAAGENQTFLRTTNGGTNWSSLPGPFQYTYDRLLFINSNIGWLTGISGIAFTSDNGSTWINQTPGLAFYGGSYFFPTGTLYTTSLSIWKTTTAGFNLNAPTNLTLTPVSTSQINLSWTDNSTDEDRFVIERSPNGSSWSAIDSVNAGVTSYQNSGLTTDQIYYYRICAKKLIFSSGYSNAEWLRTPLVGPSLSSPESGAVIPFVPVLQWTTVPVAFTYTLQVASDTNFTNIVYTITAPGLTSAAVPPSNLQNSTRYYWRAKVNSLTNQSLFTPYRNFIFQNPNYGNNMNSGNGLYYFANSTSGAAAAPSKPEYNWRDTTGSIYLIKNGSLQSSLYSGSIDDGVFRLNNILTGSNAVRFFGNNYQILYIGTNGIVSFSSFDPQLGTNIEPPTGGLSATGITNATLPLWKDFNFTDSDVPERTLCYKITSNEIIISFIKAPSYNASVDANDYVSFQIIIQYNISPSENSKISVMYNYDLTGSSFINQYNNNTILPMLVGLKGVSGQEFQYRFFNSSLQLINSGPIFGSNLALEFGPDATLLPVELASFTSTVNGGNTKLEWNTLSEQNNSGFEVQRTNAGESNWKKIAFINGNGTTNKPAKYSCEDKNLASGKYQYRLKQIDFNGNYEYFNLSNEVIIGVPNKFSLLQNYPNPFNPNTVISYQLSVDGFISLKVYDIAGKEVASLVNKNQSAGYYTVEFNGANLSSGTYFYAIQAGDFKAVKKMVLLK